MEDWEAPASTADAAAPVAPEIVFPATDDASPPAEVDEALLEAVAGVPVDAVCCVAEVLVGA